MTGEAEERLHAEAFVDFSVESIFEAVVVSDGLAEFFGEGREDFTQGQVGGLGRFIGDFGKFGEAEFAFDILATPAKNAYGYEYKIQSLMEVQDAPVISAIEEKLGMLTLPNKAEKPAPKAKGKK